MVGTDKRRPNVVAKLLIIMQHACIVVTMAISPIIGSAAKHLSPTDQACHKVQESRLYAVC